MMRKVLLKAMIAAICLTLCACNGGVDNSGTKDVQQGNTSVNRTLEVGDTIKNDMWEVTLSRADISYGTLQLSFDSEKVTNIQCSLEFEVKNRHNESQSLRDAVNDVVVKFGDNSYGECSYFYGVGETESPQSSVTDTAKIEPSDTQHMYAQISVSEKNITGKGVVELTVAGQRCEIAIES